MEGESLSQAIFTFENSVTAIFEGILIEKTLFSKDYPFRITGTLGEIVVGLKVMEFIFLIKST